MEKEEIKESESDEEVDMMDFSPDDNGNVHITSRRELKAYLNQSDHTAKKILLSHVPDVCKNEPCQLGIDEAGRGPVLGPMVYGISYAPLSKKQLLVDLGCADSKTLTEDNRDSIYDKICDRGDEMGWAVEIIPPNVIANSMYRRSKTSLNEVSMTSAFDLIRTAIASGVNIAEIYVDTVGSPEKYQARLKGLFPEFKIVVAKKADSTYPIVSAASICAKVSRDHALRAWQFLEGPITEKYGSGYPTDPATKKWLSENIDTVFGFPQIVRFSWSTAEKILESRALPVEWEDVDEDDNDGEEQETKRQRNNEKTRARAFFKQWRKDQRVFFSDRHLTSTVDL